MTKPGFAATPTKILRDSSLSLAAKGLFSILASYSNREGRAWPSITTLASDAGASEKTVRRHLDALRDVGLISWKVETTKVGRQRFYKVWRPSDPWEPTGHPDGGVGSAETVGVGSPGPVEQEPLQPEPSTTTGAAASEASEQFELISEDDVPVEVRVPNGGDIFAAWVDAYTAAKGHPPDASVNGRLSGQIRTIVKSRTDVESWRDAWRAAAACGRRGDYRIVDELVGVQSRYATGGRQNFDLKHLQESAAANLAMTMMNRPKELT